jgi:hypothetical protein
MLATYGLRSSTSSASAALELSLVSRLQEVLGTHGGIMWQQTWRAKVTPQRRRIYQLVVSVQSISGIESSGLVPTPTATDIKGASINPLRYALRGDKSNLRDWCKSRLGFRAPPARLVCWMMGYPEVWLDLAMPLFRKSRQRS